MAFAQIYIGCKCPGGETWHVGIQEEIDTVNDEIYPIPYCTLCGYSGMGLKPKIDTDGSEHWHALTPEEIEWESMQNGDFEDEW